MNPHRSRDSLVTSLLFALSLGPAHAAATYASHAVSNSATLTLIQPAGSASLGQPAMGPSGNLYGITQLDGSDGYGTLWSMTPAGSLSTVHNFTASEGWSETPLVAGSDGSLYGVTSDENAAYRGAVQTVVFKLSPTGQYSVLHRFALGDGSGNNVDGAGSGTLAIAPDGTVYGLKNSGGPYGGGTAFKISPSGTFTLLHSFGQPDGTLGPDGGDPYQIVLGADGTAYGLTAAIITPGLGGSMFLIKPDGSFAVVATPAGFGANQAQLAPGADGNVYGTVWTTTAVGGSGYLFKVTPTGAFSAVYTPSVKNTTMSGLVAGTDGDFYADVVNSLGDSIIKVTPSGKATTLHTFNGHNSIWECDIYGCFFSGDQRNLDGDGSGNPISSVNFIQGHDGYLYGLSSVGGTRAQGVIYRLATDGSTDEVLFNFDGGADGSALTPGRLVEDTNGNFYGNGGLIYRVTLNGSMKVVAGFPSSVDRLGTPTTLSWSSTGAAACALSTNIPKVTTGAVATSGSQSMTPILDIGAVHVQLTPDFVAGVNCVSADGLSFASASAQVHAPSYFGP